MEKIKKVLDFISISLIVTISIFFIYISWNPHILGIGKYELIYISPWFLAINFFLILVFIIFGFGTIRRYLRGVDKRSLLILLVILIIAFSLRQFLVPHTHRVFFDEDLYLGVGNSLATEFRNILCNYGTPTHCFDGILNKDPSGFPFLVSLIYRIVGPGEPQIFFLSTIVGTLTVFVVFLLVYFITRDKNISLIASFLFAITPIHLVWSGSTATEIFFTFFSLLSLSMMVLYLKSRRYMILLLSLASAAYSAQIRPEGIFFLFILGLFVLLMERNLLRLLRSKKNWLSILFLVVLLMSQIMQLSIFKNEDWGAPDGKKFGLLYFEENSLPNISFWFTNKYHPLIFTILSIVGFIYSIRKNLRLSLFLVLWWISYFVLFSSFYAGSFSSGGIGSRYIVMYFTPMIVFAAFGFNEIMNLRRRYKFITIISLLLIIAISFLPILPFITIPDQQAQYVRDMHDFVMEHVHDINSSCWVLTHNPSIFLVQRMNSLQTWYSSNKFVMDRIYNKTNCVLWLEGAWCLFEPHKSGVCKYIHDNYKLKVLYRLVREGNPNQVFTIYQVYRK